MDFTEPVNVLITGGSGFLARGLMRRARQDGWPCRFTVYSRDEYKQDLCRRRYPEHRYVLGDICDLPLLTAVMTGHELVVHAAALKYVPEAEFNVRECIRVNILGSQCVLEAARQTQVNCVIATSTDKAVEPVNTYGMSKALMERLFMEYSRYNVDSRCVRYGNVVGSTGSVIPLFQRQRQELGKLLVTNPLMTRFWMSVDEAIDLIRVGLSELASAGSVMVPRPKAMTIGALAELIAEGVPVEVIGERPGEKLHEELLHYQESVRVVNHAGRFFELRPPGEVVTGVEPFTLSSHFAEQISALRMKEMIDDAVSV